MIRNLLSLPVQANLQQAIHEELYASNLYKHIANQCQRIGLFGAAKHFLNESKDETEHYQAIAEYLNDRGSVAEIPSIEAIDETVTSLQDAIEVAYQTEVDLGANYEKWYRSADPTTQRFLLKYLEIQQESIGEYGDLLSRLKLAGDDNCAILLIDQELSQ